ncbi:hypothetical protein CDV36_007934 [Fusarium kuroshium]|uniref:protein S-acyltransferase n=1 Tax=Fusarium kuroshium TaxID=2010991 RepID=A0A3M2S589_9HYPO|nr:hypothetical protein CDV36_007934 [Fusarium kuroshium]
MAIDWKPYEREVNRWYLHEGKTANEVIQLLLRKYNLEVTQFKAKFGGCKKISSKEWSILIPKIREREANGLKSVIYVCGKAIKHESMARSIRRYAKPYTDVSQSKATVGIDTIGQHRIEIRTPSEPGTQLPWDFSLAEVQPSNEGENSSNSQGDEVDVDEEFGLAEMDVEPGDQASAGNAIYPSPSMFLGSLDHLPSNLLETLSFSDNHGIQMESNGMVLSSSQWLPPSPSIDLTTLFPFQHTFKSFWDSPDISVLTLKGCEAAVDVAKRIGIFVPDYSRHKFLPKLGISPAQTGVPSPILQSIEEIEFSIAAHSMLDMIIKRGVDVNESLPECSALASAILRYDHDTVKALLDAGAFITDRILFSSVCHRSPEIHALLRERMGHKPHDFRFVCWELVNAARKGNRELSKVSVPDDIVPLRALEQAMCRAIESEDLPATRTFLQRRTDPNAGMVAFRKHLSTLNLPINSYSFLLHGLLDWGQFDCLELALQAGARTEDKYEGLTPMQLAVLKKDSEAIRLLLQHGANINGCPRPVGNDTAASEMLLLSPIRPKGIDKFNDSIKHMLFSHVDSSGFPMGVFANKEPYFPHTPLQLASSSEDPDSGIVELLLSQGADINAPAAEWYGRTAFQGAISAKKPNIEVVELLLKEGADVNEPAAQVGGVTALQGAAIRGDIQLVRLLLERGAQIDAPGAHKEGRTALEGAAEQGRIEMLRFLLSKGAGLVSGYTRAIELAEKELHIGIVKLLREEQRKLHEMGWGFGPLGLDLDPL